MSYEREPMCVHGVEVFTSRYSDKENEIYRR